MAKHAPRLPLEIWGRAILVRLQAQADRTALGRGLFEFLMFGLKQAWACVFGGAMLALLFLTLAFYPHDAALARYDFVAWYPLMTISFVLVSVVRREEHTSASTGPVSQ